MRVKRFFEVLLVITRRFPKSAIGSGDYRKDNRSDQRGSYEAERGEDGDVNYIQQQHFHSHKSEN